VRNTGALNDGDMNGSGIGLANVRERLERQFGPRGQFDISQRNGDVVARIEVLGG
jgi:LytS/YehU family sensor histidine kinase